MNFRFLLETQTMPAKSLILKPTTFADFAALYRFLRAEPMRKLLSSGQVETIADILDASLPGDVALEQRTLKGVTYVHLDGDFFGSVTQAGRFVAPAGPAKMGAPMTRRQIPTKF